MSIAIRKQLCQQWTPARGWFEGLRHVVYLGGEWLASFDTGAQALDYARQLEESQRRAEAGRDALSARLSAFGQSLKGG